jgi:hypothetical protein
MPITKELLKQLREMESRTLASDWNIIRVIFRTKNGEETASSWPMEETLLLEALRNNAKALIDEVERLQGENEALKNPLPTKEEEKAFYDKAYHVHNTGCGLNCQK